MTAGPPAIAVVRREPVPVIQVRATTTLEGLGATLEDLLPAVWQWLEEQDATVAGPPFTRYLAFTPERLEVAAGWPVTAETAARLVATPPFEHGMLPGGDLLVVVHAGPYEQLGDAHLAIEDWLRSHGRAAAAPVWETYLTDPGGDPDPAQWRTEVACLLAPPA